MFAVLQFPLTDVRAFLDDDSQRTAAPAWPIVHVPDEPHKVPFVRGFGRAARRLRGGTFEWSAEEAYCDVSHALKFTGAVLKHNPDRRAGDLRTYCAFRRLFWDGQFARQGSVVGRVEIGFGVRLPNPDAPLSGSRVGQLLDDLLSQEVRISQRVAKAPMPLDAVGPSLATLYLQASTVSSQKNVLEGSDWWVQSASPFVVLEYVRNAEVEALPARTVPITLSANTLPGIRTFLGRRIVAGRERPVWFLECDPRGYDRDALRRLRLNVTRLHAAIASLKIILDLQQKGRIAPVSAPVRKNLQDCLGRYLPFLYREQYMGFPWTDFLQAALTLIESLTPGEMTTLRALHPDAGRGLRAQMDLAVDRVTNLQPGPAIPIQWDIFIAHAGGDTRIAEDLYDLLKGKARVFLDSKTLVLGDEWDVLLRDAQRRSAMTVVLVGKTADAAYYLRSEIAAAISMARLDAERHRVVPVYLQGGVGRTEAQPYGLNLKHGLEVDGTNDLPSAAARLLDALAKSRRVI